MYIYYTVVMEIIINDKPILLSFLSWAIQVFLLLKCMKVVREPLFITNYNFIEKYLLTIFFYFLMIIVVNPVNN